VATPCVSFQFMMQQLDRLLHLLRVGSVYGFHGHPLQTVLVFSYVLDHWIPAFFDFIFPDCWN